MGHQAEMKASLRSTSVTASQAIGLEEIGHDVGVDDLDTVLGGTGFTFEHDANLCVERAHLLGHAFGDSRDVPSRLIRLPAAV